MTIHAVVPRGGWDAGGGWAPVPFVDNDAAERLFRAKVLLFLVGEGLLSDERAKVLMSWNHNSGFSADDSVQFEPEDRKSMEKGARLIYCIGSTLHNFTTVPQYSCEGCKCERGTCANPSLSA